MYNGLNLNRYNNKKAEASQVLAMPPPEAQLACKLDAPSVIYADWWISDGVVRVHSMHL